MNFKAGLANAVENLDRAKKNGLFQNYALIGGFAVALHGVPRATDDIDFAIDIEDRQCNALAASLGASYSTGDSQDPLIGVFSWNLQHVNIQVQLVRFPPKLSSVIFSDRENIRFETFDIPSVSWKGLVLLKLYGGSALDVRDAEQVIQTRQTDTTSMAALKREAQALGLGQQLDTLLRAEKV